MEGRADVTNLSGLVTVQAGRAADKVALVEGDRQLTWGELEDAVERVARGLSALGLVGGHRVALALSNSIEFVVCYLAVLRGGLVAVPINPTSTPGEISRVAADSGARVCLAGEESIAAVRAALPPGPGAVPIVAVDAAPAAGELALDALVGDTPVVPPRDLESLAVLLYTSGTSGTPRAVMLSHRALLANVEQSAATRPPPVAPSDIVLGVLPMFHVYGLNAVLGQVLLTGATLVIGRRFDADRTLELIQHEQVTCVPVAPPVVIGWLDRPDVRRALSSVHTLLSGAAPLPEEVVREFEERTGVSVEQGYGLTEAAPVVASTIGVPVHKPGSVGRPLPGVELRIVDADGRDVEPVDPGEIWIRGDNLFDGYWPDGAGGPDPEGWLSTGDIGFRDADGDLFLVDRLDDLVIVSGFNVYPSEVEDVVREVEGVAECAVVGVPEATTGQAVVAYVVPTAAAAEPGGALAAAVAAHCAERLARFKVPARVETVDELPRTTTGDVVKSRLRSTDARAKMGLA